MEKSPGTRLTARMNAKAFPGEDRPTRVLVADDNADQVLCLTELLQSAGYEVRGVHDGMAALEAAQEFHPDVYLIDIGMPKLDGYGVAREIRQRYGAQPLLIALTAYATTRDKLAAVWGGFNFHVPKPCDPERLLDLLQPLPAPIP